MARGPTRTGVFAVDRRVFDHPVFAPEPFTEREAWLWLVGAAAFKPMQVRAGRAVVNLARGQLAFSERFLAEKFDWSKSRVHRFLNRLKIESMVDLSTDHETNLITICNYNKYAFDGTSRGPAREPQIEPTADQPRTKEEELKELKEDHDGDARATPVFEPSSESPKSLIRPEATEIATEIAVLCGHPTPRDWPPGFCGAAYTVETWLAGGWTRPAIIAGVQEALARKRDGPPESVSYFAKPIARFIARNSGPLPKLEADEVRQDRGYGQTAKSGLAAIDRIFDRVAESNASASASLHEAPVLSLPPRSIHRS